MYRSGCESDSAKRSRQVRRQNVDLGGRLRSLLVGGEVSLKPLYQNQIDAFESWHCLQPDTFTAPTIPEPIQCIVKSSGGHAQGDGEWRRGVHAPVNWSTTLTRFVTNPVIPVTTTTSPTNGVAIGRKQWVIRYKRLSPSKSGFITEPKRCLGLKHR